MQRIISIASTILLLAAAALAGCGPSGGEESSRGDADTTAGRAPASSNNVTAVDSGASVTMNDTLSPPDTTAPFTFTLRWATKRTDLDLYLIRPGGDTIYWNNRKIGNDSLDGDDNNGEGPEDILYHARASRGGARPIELAVHYAAPSGGPSTKATVFSRFGTGGATRIGTCTLRPGEWWVVGRFDPMMTVPTSNDSACRRQSAPRGLGAKGGGSG